MSDEFHHVSTTNEDRADWAEQALEAFPPIDGEDDCAVRDLICDLLHAARRRGQQPLEEAQMGIGAFLAEEADPPDGWAKIFDVTIEYQERPQAPATPAEQSTIIQSRRSKVAAFIASFVTGR